MAVPIFHFPYSSIGDDSMCIIVGASWYMGNIELIYGYTLSDLMPLLNNGKRSIT